MSCEHVMNTGLMNTKQTVCLIPLKIICGYVGSKTRTIQNQCRPVLTVEANGPDRSLVTVYGPQQMPGQLWSLRFGLRERHTLCATRE